MAAGGGVAVTIEQVAFAVVQIATVNVRVFLPQRSVVETPLGVCIPAADLRDARGAHPRDPPAETIFLDQDYLRRTRHPAVRLIDDGGVDHVVGIAGRRGTDGSHPGIFAGQRAAEHWLGARDEANE